MKRGREFPSITSGQLHSMSPIPSPTPSAPSPTVNEGMSQSTPACPSSCASTSASKRGRGRTRGVSLENSLGSGSGSGKLSVHIPEGECGGVSSTAATLSTKIGMLVRGLIPISVNKWVDVPAEVKEYIMDRVLDHFDLDYTRHEDKRREQNKKNRSKLTVNHVASSRSFQRTLACVKNQESGNINPAELYKKNYTNKDGIWTSEGHQLAKARDEIEAMRAAREKDLQEFAKKQAEMEATLRDHREEQQVEQERIRLEQEERMKRAHASGARGAHAKEQERMRKEQERLQAEISKELEKKMSSVMEKKMNDMSKRLFNQFGVQKGRCMYIVITF
ncbi:hypothetical protein CJ030_MR7G021992 [Morella rubra]|uniref:Uncharacterized protein n=1 Tax=Morella rubra TaxID=262757 RepID=A0A6A1V1K0_9ROSI|nr:hypothetical protein CJ030_MR7G021992 [Morella rubra]